MAYTLSGLIHKWRRDIATPFQVRLANLKCSFHKSGSKIECSNSILRNVKFQVRGLNNLVSIGPNVCLTNCQIYVSGNGNRLFISGKGGGMQRLEFYLEDDNNVISIGRCCTIEGGHFAATEGKSIHIGDDCMFSSDIEIRTGDSHAIYDDSGNRINQGLDVVVGNHVWIGAHARILKGSNIPKGSVVANSSVVTKQFQQENCVYAGVPATKVKENITWSRER